MATNEIVTNVSWNMEFPPQEDARDERDRPLTQGRWLLRVLSADNFNIVYPITPYDEEKITVPYDPQGQPVTLLDLLTTIYEFYQEPLSQDDLNLLLIHHEPNEDEPLKTRLDALLGRTIFLSLDRDSPHTYRLIHE